MKAVVERNEIPGILGYLDNRPVAWCSVAQREVFSVLDRSPFRPIMRRYISASSTGA